MRQQRIGRAGAPAGFTLIELMIVVAIVAILSLALLPMQWGHVNAARMSEGIAGVGVVRTALRTYAAAHQGQYPTLSAAHGNQLEIIFISPTSLDGKFLTATDYSVTSTSSGYTIRATLPTDSSYWYQVDQDGNETKGGF